MKEKKDIFDRIMSLPGLRCLEPFYKKHKEVLLYVLFGGLTFIVSITTYALLNIFLGMNELVANVISWIFAVGFAYATNRIWVFAASTHGFTENLGQIASFFAGRVVTLIIEEVILLIFITILRFPSVMVKVIAQIVVIVLNYFISKFWVFRKKNNGMRKVL